MLADYGDDEDYGVSGTGPYGWDRLDAAAAARAREANPMQDTTPPPLPSPTNPFKSGGRDNWEDVASMFGFTSEAPHAGADTLADQSTLSASAMQETASALHISGLGHLATDTPEDALDLHACMEYDMLQDDTLTYSYAAEPSPHTPLRTPTETPIKAVPHTPHQGDCSAHRETAGVLDSPYIARRGVASRGGGGGGGDGGSAAGEAGFEALLDDKEKLFAAFSQFCRVLVSMQGEGAGGGAGGGSPSAVAGAADHSISQAATYNTESTGTATPSAAAGLRAPSVSVATQAPGTPVSPPRSGRGGGVGVGVGASPPRAASVSIGTQFSSPERRRTRFSTPAGGAYTAGRRDELSDIFVWGKARRSRGYSKRFHTSLPTLVGASPTRVSTASSPYSVFRTRYVALMDSPWVF